MLGFAQQVKGREGIGIPGTCSSPSKTLAKASAPSVWRRRRRLPTSRRRARRERNTSCRGERDPLRERQRGEPWTQRKGMRRTTGRPSVRTGRAQRTRAFSWAVLFPDVSFENSFMFLFVFFYFVFLVVPYLFSLPFVSTFLRFCNSAFEPFKSEKASGSQKSETH